MAKTILILNGPNLNMLGSREPEIYGRDTLEDIKKLCEQEAKTLGIAVDFRQSNSEAELIGWIQEAAKPKSIGGLIMNAAALTHTSVALHDALKLVEAPIIEVHLSNLFKREPFRHHSYITPLAKGLICGFGAKGYLLALKALA